MRKHPRAVTRLLLIVLLLALAGCGSAPVKPGVPEVVRVQVPQYVPLPAELTKPCPAQRAKERTVGAVVSAYNANIPVQTDCDARMARIRQLQPANENP